MTHESTFLFFAVCTDEEERTLVKQAEALVKQFSQIYNDRVGEKENATVFQEILHQIDPKSVTEFRNEKFTVCTFFFFQYGEKYNVFVYTENRSIQPR